MNSAGEGKSATGRRTLLLLAGAVIGTLGLARGVSWVFDQVADNLDVAPMADPPGFRRLSLLGATSGAIDPFAGIPRGDKDRRAAPTASPQTLCMDLFGVDRFAPEVVPIALFSDFNCLNCELLVDDIRKLQENAPHRIHVKRHEWPILGERSETSARAALAAGLQGAHGAFSRRMQGTVFEPTPAYLRELAGTAGIDPDRLLLDMQSEEVTRQLATTLALVRRFGFPGTPALVVGRTAVVGTIRSSTLMVLVDVERALGPPPSC